MRGTLARRLIAVLGTGLTAALGVTTATAASAGVHDPVPIGPDQYFSGYLNGHPPGSAVLKVVCPGPSNTGHPVGNQTIEVKTAKPVSAADVGYTGSAGKRIGAALGPSASTSLLAVFTSYFVPMKVPTKITVPCSGTGKLVFVPAPHSKAARSAVLTVTFLNIGT